jgi:S-adenosylmethionine:tRNA ribosyltransferase-isomerase
MALNTDLFDYHLPALAIAQHPAEKRDHSRLMLINRATKTAEHRFFYELPEILERIRAERKKEIILFRNNAKVIKARMFLQRQTGAEIEVLLLRPGKTHREFWCLAKPLKKVSIGEKLFFEDKSTAELKEKSETGEALFEFFEDPLKLSERIGHLPLPPYIGKADEKEAETRYQTVYAKKPVAAAAPTAGLHFTPELIKKIESQGNRFTELTLHVGLDTFRPISTENVEEHKIHTETYEISTEAENFLKQKDIFKIAIGTTSLRTMEDFLRRGFPNEKMNAASLFVYPPQTIISADALITNFHLPKSTLMCLVSAFLTPKSLDGIAWLKELYAEALAKGYRFYSYGDAMMII